VPINPHSISRPVHVTAKTYLPSGATQYKVKDNDTWVTIAAGLHISPWALIRFNYPGLSFDLETARKEVNWYLQNYVGCTQLTTDSNNFRFSLRDYPGQIWLPAPSVTATADDAVRDTVLSVLRGPGIASLNFGVGKFYIASSDYAQVADAIERGFITVRANPTFHNNALYHWGADHYIEVAPGITDFALVVHECTHAIFDIGDYHSVVSESEGVAYIAQALYSISRWGPFHHVEPLNLADPLSSITWQAIWNEAIRLATHLQTHPYVSTDDAAGLFWAISNNSWYRGRVGTSDSYNGLDPAYY
jgi:hypothetical protein